jgi:hypothetical protein
MANQNSDSYLLNNLPVDVVPFEVPTIFINPSIYHNFLISDELINDDSFDNTFE